MGLARSADINRLKSLAGRLASTNAIPLPFSCDMKSDRGFNSDAAGWMLIPIRYLGDYDEDPIGYGLVLYTRTITNDCV